jgi:hypothetical protein
MGDQMVWRWGRLLPRLLEDECEEVEEVLDLGYQIQ